MGMEDRDWYREDFKRRQAIDTRMPSQTTHQPAPQRLPVRCDTSQPPSLGAGSVLIFFLLMLTFFAVGSFFV